MLVSSWLRLILVLISVGSRLLFFFVRCVLNSVCIVLVLVVIVLDVWVCVSLLIRFLRWWCFVIIVCMRSLVCGSVVVML